MAVGSTLFFRDGYGATTMAEVAQVARVSKTTLYSRFPSKSDLFRAIVAAQIESWENRIYSAQMEECETLEQVLLVYGDMALRAGMVPDTVQLNRLLFSESGRFPELAEAARARAEKVIAFLANYLQTFADRDGVPCKDPVAAAILFQNITMGWYGMMILANRTVAPEESDAWLKGAVKAFLASRPLW